MQHTHTHHQDTVLARHPIWVGLGLTVITVAIAWQLPHAWAMQLFAALLALIGAVYVGFAISQNKHLEQQFAVAIGFMLFGLLGLWVSPWWLVSGYVLHGVWDLLHHRHEISVQLTSWYAPFCLLYDWGMALAIALFWI